MGIVTDLLVQPALVGVMVAMKDILYNHYLPESPHVWVDVGMHMAAKLISAGVTMEFLIPNMGDMARMADPVIHGALVGVVKEQFINTDNISSLGFVETGRMPMPHHYTFQVGFVEGLAFGGVSSGVAYAVSKMGDS